MGADFEKFVLLSDALRGVRRDGERSPDFLQWRMYLDDPGLDLEGPVFDERHVDLVVQGMVARVRESFERSYLPGSVKSLLDAYSVRVKNSEAYLAFALESQRQRLVEFLRRHDVEAKRKKLSNMARGYDRRNEELHALLTNPDDFVDRRIKYHRNRILRNRSYDLGMLMDIVPSLVFDDLFAELRRISNELLELDASGQLLAMEVVEVEDADEILRSTVSGLAGLVKTKVTEVVEMKSSADANLAEPKAVFSVSQPKVGKRKKKSGSSKKPKRTSGSVASESLEPIDIGIKQLKDFVAKAGRFGEIRVLAGNADYSQDWDAVLRRFGFEGKVKFVGYHDLKRTGDVQTPVIVPRQMNTHAALWKKSKFSNLTVVNEGNPTIILRYLEQRGGL